MKFYITRYALTKGIVEEELEEYKITRDDDLSFKRGLIPIFYFKNDYFTDLDNAKADAKQRRDKKIKSLQKQILKLQKMKF